MKSIVKKSKSFKPGSDGGQVAGRGACVACKEAALEGNPVNAVLGIKVLPSEVDVAFDAPMGFTWARSYYSDQIGNSWLGQGWSSPYSMRLVRQFDDSFIYLVRP